MINHSNSIEKEAEIEVGELRLKSLKSAVDESFALIQRQMEDNALVIEEHSEVDSRY